MDAKKGGAEADTEVRSRESVSDEKQVVHSGSCLNLSGFESFPFTAVVLAVNKQNKTPYSKLGSSVVKFLFRY